MKALSVCQPWASLIILGWKSFETRSWRTAHRGPLAVHASATFSPAARSLCRVEPLRTLLCQAGYPNADGLPVGAVLGVVDLADCLPVEDLRGLTGLDRALGDFSPGRWAWRLARPRRLAAPVPCRGRLGVFDGPDLPDELLCALPTFPATRART